MPGDVAVILLDGDNDDILLKSVPNGVHVITAWVDARAHDGAIGSEHRLDELLQTVRSLLVAAQPVPSLEAGGPGGRRRRVLTPRELEVLRLISGGDTAAEVARTLGITVAGVENAKRRIYEKLGVQSQTHAVADALRRGLLVAPRPGRARGR
jgi:DNA-binding CsgD family transcriptional regulator